MKENTQDLKLCYIGGGSRNWAWVFIKDLAFETQIGGTIYLYDIDAASASANETLGNQVMAEYNPGRWKFKAEPSLEQALKNSDFVFISILPKDFSQMAVDVHTPEKYGIYQSVGDTVGAGGLNRALRTAPMYEKIAEAIKRWSPDAWVLNYTNPMAVCTRTLYRAFPEIKAFGCCHEVFGTQKLLRTVIIRAGLAGESAIKREDITTRVVGINHFTWIDRASWGVKDLFPLYAEFAEKYAETGFAEGGDGNWFNSYFTSGERVKIDLFRRYGLIAAAGDRHLAEFCPPSWYLKNPETVKEWQFSLTPVSWRVTQREELKQKSAAYRQGAEKLVPENSGEEGIRQIKALLGLGNLTTNVNLPNRGQMPGFPLSAVVETNAVFARDRVEPVITEGMPPPLRSLVVQHIENQEGIVEAALNRDLAAAFKVFLNDPQIRQLSRTDALSLFKAMTSQTLGGETPAYQ
ncbi:MAG: alpha-glucosidase/alpha-galactosidase [Spirochaetaceae bacterium]|jgi:alpha-galactosidase|nr:alpha-glucosidase/alpha-galactosidase [Spirochaetaceae bacterium]